MPPGVFPRPGIDCLRSSSESDVAEYGHVGGGRDASALVNREDVESL